MPLQPPVLDDRRFADLVAEARARIPRYTPEWTDFNDSDPGITLVQLFAWLTEMLAYRLNQVPDLHYIKFLQLLGIAQRPAAPATADLTFTVQKGVPFAFVPPRTRVGVAGSDPAVVFETLEAFGALGGSLKDIEVYDGVSFVSAMAANETIGKVFAPFGRAPIVGSALCLGFDVPADFPEQEVSVMFYLKDPAAGPAALRCGAAVSPLVLPVQVVWEYLAAGGWLPLTIVRDDTQAFTRNGLVRFRGPRDIVAATVGPPDPSKPKLYWVRGRLADGEYEIPPALDRILLNTVAAESAQTVREETVGGSDATAGQSFTLRHSPVLAGSLVLEIEEGRGFEPWTEVPDFFGSGSDDAHFTLNRGSGEIRFGDGRHGRVPLAGQDNIVARTYRYGGGANTNTGAKTITDLQTFVRGIDTVTNERPAAGGADEEPVADTLLRGPASLRTRNRAVTAEDFEFLATQAPGARVGRAKALALRNPDFPGASVPGSVTVIVVPDWPPHAPGPPVPTQATLTNVCRYLDCHRLITTELHVIGPTYVRLDLALSIVVPRTRDSNQVKTAVETGLRTFYDPLTGGEIAAGDTKGTGWPFGGTIYFSDVYRVALAVDGVDRVEHPVITLNGAPWPEGQDVPTPEGTLVDLRTVGIQIQFAATP